MTNASSFFDQALTQTPDAGKATFKDEALPEGVYPLIVESCAKRKYVDGFGRKPEDIATACGADPTLVPGEEIAMTFVVTEGAYARRKIWGTYTIQAASNQKTYGEFTPEKKVAAGVNDLCGLMRRLGKPADWPDWGGKLFNGYITAKKDKNGKTRNDLRCTVKAGEENAPTPSAPIGTMPKVVAGAAPF